MESVLGGGTDCAATVIVTEELFEPPAPLQVREYTVLESKFDVTKEPDVPIMPPVTVQEVAFDDDHLIVVFVLYAIDMESAYIVAVGAETEVNGAEQLIAPPPEVPEQVQFQEPVTADAVP